MPKAFCGLKTCAKKVLLNLWVLWEKNSTKYASSLIGVRGQFFLSQSNTDEQITQHSTETLSQPISQNVTANISWNALFSLYAEGLLWVRNVRQEGSVKSVSSVRDKPPQRERKTSTKYASSLIGVTSHITPLSIRRGAGGEAPCALPLPISLLRIKNTKPVMVWYFLLLYSTIIM